MMHRLIVLITLLAVTTADLRSQCSVQDQHPDYAALMALFNSTNGFGWSIRTGWENGAVGISCDPCADEWFGVTCFNNRVTEINLGFDGNNLIGNLPDALGELDELISLTIRGDLSVTGPIPKSIFSLDDLVFVNFHGLDLTGGLPVEIKNAKNLQTLMLNGNTSLGGQMPKEIGEMTELRTLGVSNCGMSGDIPAEFCDLTKLSAMWLSRNAFTGQLPSCLGDFNWGNNMYVGSNSFDDCYPSSIYKSCIGFRDNMFTDYSIAVGSGKIKSTFCYDGSKVCCEGDLSITGEPIGAGETTGIYRSHGKISVQGSVDLAKKMVFRANSGIDVLKTFEVVDGTKSLELVIDPNCNNN